MGRPKKNPAVPVLDEWMKIPKEDREEYAKLMVCSGLAVVSAIFMRHIKDMPTWNDSKPNKIQKLSLPVAIFGGVIGPFIGIGMLLQGDQKKKGIWRKWFESFSKEEMVACGVAFESMIVGGTYWAMCHPELLAELPPDSFEFDAI